VKYRSSIFYIVGALLWISLFSLLKANDSVNVFSYIESLWNTRINNYFSKDLSGAIAFYRTEDEHYSQRTLLYTAKYYPNGPGSDYQLVSLADTVDFNSWSMTSMDTTTVTYTDKSYRYVLYNNSGGISMGVFDK